MKILIADDDVIPRLFLQTALVKAGHEVIVARDGAEAWQLLQRAEAPRLAILDWLMPGLDGVEVCRKVRQWDHAPYVYLILLTSKDQQEDIIAGLEAGADDYLIKPFDPQELEARLRAGQRILDLQAALLTSLEQLAQAHQQEVEIGAKIQQTLLLGQPPCDLAGARVAALTIPSQPVDGDFYDFFQYSAYCLDIVVGDVMGKGIPAALLGAAIKSAPLRALSRLLTASAQNTLPEPEEIVGLVHSDVTRQFISLGVFATLCYARLDLDQGRLVLVDCGHTKPVCFRRRTGTCELLQGDNMPLGFSEGELYRQVAFPLETGDMVVFYSDGVTEARNAAGAFFGVDRLMQVINAQNHLEPEPLIDALRSAVGAFIGGETWADDVTCVIVALEETGAACPLVQAQCEVTSTATELALIRTFVHTFCQELPRRVLDAEGLSQLELAVTEAASNIMRHAYHGRTDQRIQVTAEAFADRVCIRLWHRGTAFDPATVEPPVFDGSRDGGFGVYIIAHCVDEVRYIRDERGENCICLVKKRQRRGKEKSRMELMCEPIGDVMVVALAGAQLDASTAEEFKRDITPVLEAHAQIVFDLRRLAFVDSSGLGAFLSCLRHVQAKGGDLKLCSLLPPVRTLFELVRMHRIFHIFDTQAAAIRAFQPYGIHYEYGLFQQEIRNGYQEERPDNWLASGTPWEIERIDEACLIPVYGRIEHALDRDGQYNPMWMDWKILIGVPHDLPIVGYGGQTVNYLRLYSARASAEFDMRIFNAGDYLKAVEQKLASETITKVLYPSDAVEAGQELRLIQEYFLVACAIRDIVKRYLQTSTTFDAFSSQVAIQLNDTHPAVAVAELMRVLIDENDLPWEQAWVITQATLGYTNHTLLPEALEKWSVTLFEHVLPRHLQIINEINHRFLAHVAGVWPGDTARLQRMAIITDGEPRHIHMGHLAIVGSHAVNGVSALHTELVQTTLVPDFFQLWPERFNNKTNGITQRRWLLQANPCLAQLLTDTIGVAWITDLDALQGLEPMAQDAGFQQEFLRIKRANKARLAIVIRDLTRVSVDPETLFDVQVKRIHEYKRQLLNILHIVHEYLCLIEEHQPPTVPRTYIFAGKAAPGYWAAKQIIKLIHSVGHVINTDPRVQGQIRVVFIPDYRVSLAEKIIPAADLSEQISMAGTEASGTGNMKFALNGALTIGTLDGANIEIMQAVGAENIFIFGLHAPDIHTLRAQGAYQPREYYARYPALKRVLDALESNCFCGQEPGLFRWIYHALLDQGDAYCHLADLPSYIAVQAQVAAEFTNLAGWARKAILNVARVGTFSSDRTIRQYAKDIWQIESIPEGSIAR